LAVYPRYWAVCFVANFPSNSNLAIILAFAAVQSIIEQCGKLITRMALKKCYAVEDGLTDSVRQLLLSHDPYDRYVLNM